MPNENIDIITKANAINLDTDFGRQIIQTKQYYDFTQEVSFVQETLEVLNGDNVAIKKNYFLDNQESIQDCMNNMKELLDVLQQLGTKNPEYNNDAAYQGVSSVISDSILALEDGIARFNKELIDSVSAQSTKEDIIVSQETIKDAVKNNRSTKQIRDELIVEDSVPNFQQQNRNSIDPNTQQIINQFKQQPQQRPQKPQRKKYGYLLFDEKSGEVLLLEGANLDNKTINAHLLKSGFANARVFKLQELPTKQKTIQQVVTVLQ